MLGVTLEGGRQSQRPILSPVFRGGDIHNTEFALSQRAGLVEDHHIDLAGSLQRQPVPDQDAVAGPESRRDGNDQWDGKSERVRAGDHEHGNDAVQDFDVERIGNGPGNGSHERSCQGNVEEPAGSLIRQDLCPRFGLLGLLDQAHDAGQGGLLAGGCHAHTQAALAVDGPGDDLCACHLVDRRRLTGDHRLVDIRMPFRHLTVGGNACARADEDEIAMLERGDRHSLGHVTVVDALGGVGHELRQLVERTGSLAHRAHLEPVTEQHDVDQRDELPEETFPQVQELRRDAVHERNGNCQRDERHHTRLAFPDLGDCHLQEGDPAVDEDDHRKDKGDPLAAGEGWRREAEPHLDHLAVQQDRDAQEQAPPEANPEHLLMTAVVRAMPGVSRVGFVEHFLFYRHRMILMRPVGRVVARIVIGMIRHVMVFVLSHSYLIRLDSLHWSRDGTGESLQMIPSSQVRGALHRENVMDR